MFKPLELFIGLRYTRAKRRNHFISFISLTSMLGIALGVTALITVLSVMNGFEKELKTRILGMASHITVNALAGTDMDWQTLESRLVKHPKVVGTAPFVQAEAMLTRGRNVRGAVIRGIDPAHEPEVSEIRDYMKLGDLGELRNGTYRVLLGVGLARVLGVSVGDKVTLISPQAKVTPAGILPRLRRFTVAGVFEVGHGQYDTALAMIHIGDAKRMFRLDDRSTNVRVKLTDLYLAPGIGNEFERALGPGYWVRDWTQVHANFFRALRTEKTVMFVILTLIVAVAAFNIVSTLIMVVTDKQADIAILRTLGATPLNIMNIFIVQGTVVGLVGTALGMAGGIALASNVETIVPAIEALLETKFLPETVYYISEVPSDLRRDDVMYIAVIAFAMSILATIYPAWRASRTQPAQALRYE